MIIENLKKELTRLEDEEKRFNFIKESSFSSQDDFDLFFEIYKSDFEKLKEVRVRIRYIKSLLMTPEEKSDRQEYLKKLRKKFSKD